MKRLSLQDLIDLVDGAAIFSAGGGGDPKVGYRIAEDLASGGMSAQLITSSEVPDNVKLVNFACVGATTAIEYDSAAALKTLEALEEYAKISAYAAIAVELGGFNTLAAVDVAARHNIPILDADGAGRAVPEVHLKVYTIDGIPLAPMAVANVHADNVVIVKETIDSKSAERIARVLADEWNGSAYTARRILTSVQAKTSPIQSTLSKSMFIGKLLRQSVDPVKATLKETRGCKLFEGKIEECNRHTRGGFTFVNVKLQGTKEFANSTFEFKAKNEVLVAYKEHKLVAIAPDIITPINPETGRCITAEKLQENDKIAILGIPSPNKWRMKQGLELWKDVLQRSDIREKYVPIEKLVSTPI